MRTRITVVVALLVALALTGAGLIIYALGSAGIESEAQARADQEIAEFRQLRDGVDPDTGRRFASVTRLLEVFLLQNVPRDDELLVAWVDGEASLPVLRPAPGCSRRTRPSRPPSRQHLEEGGTVPR